MCLSSDLLPGVELSPPGTTGVPGAPGALCWAALGAALPQVPLDEQAGGEGPAQLKGNIELLCTTVLQQFEVKYLDT